MKNSTFDVQLINMIEGLNINQKVSLMSYLSGISTKKEVSHEVQRRAALKQIRAALREI